MYKRNKKKKNIHFIVWIGGAKIAQLSAPTEISIEARLTQITGIKTQNKFSAGLFGIQQIQEFNSI